MEVTGLSHVLQLNTEHSTHPSGCGGSRTRLGPLNGHTLVGGRTPFAELASSAGSGCTYPDRHIDKKHYSLLAVHSFIFAGFEVRITSLFVPQVDGFPVISSSSSWGYGGCCSRGGMYAGHKISTSPLPQTCGSPLDFPAGGMLAESLRALLSC